MLYIALGRNVGENPMGHDTWIQFAESVENVVMMGERLTYADTWATGESRYDDMPEETGIFVWFDKNSDLGQDTKDALAGLAKQYGQEAIAYSVSVTNFIEGVN
jgi:hypothetical protein